MLRIDRIVNEYYSIYTLRKIAISNLQGNIVAILEAGTGGSQGRRQCVKYTTIRNLNQ